MGKGHQPMHTKLSSFFDGTHEIHGEVPTFRLFINDLWLEASGGRTFYVDTPINDAIVARVPDAAKIDVEAAIDAALAGSRAMEAIPGINRIELFDRARELLARERQDFVRFLTPQPRNIQKTHT